LGEAVLYNFTSLCCLAGIVTSTFFTTAIAHSEIKIGIAGPLSGSTLNVGEMQEIGAQRAIADINSSGGLLGEEIIITSVDDACEPGQAKAAAKQLVSEGVVFVVGHACSGASLAVGKIYEDAGIIMMSPSSTNPKITEAGISTVFRVIGRDDEQGRIAGDYLADNNGNGNIAILHDGQAFGLGIAEFAKKQLNKRGVTEVLFDSFKPGQDDYQSVVDKLIEIKADVVYVGGYQGDIGIIIRQAKPKLPNLQLLAGDSLVNLDFITISGDAGIGAKFTFGPDMRLNPEAKGVVAAIRDEDAYEPDGYTLYAYGAVQAWAQAVEQAKTTKTNAVISVLRDGKFDTVLGKIGFDKKGDVTGISGFVWYVFEEENYVLDK